MSTQPTLDQQTTLAQQALQVFDHKGEEAMWSFLSQNQPEEPDTTGLRPFPRTAYLEDGSKVHLLDGRYTLLETLDEPERPSTADPSLIPRIFKHPLPLFRWPNQESLYDEIIQLAIETAFEQKTPGTPDPTSFSASDVRELIRPAFQAAYSITLMNKPESPDLTDYLDADLMSLAKDLFDGMSPPQQQKLMDQAAAFRPDREP